MIKFNGKSHIYDENDKLYQEDTFEDDILRQRIIFYEDGKIESEENYSGAETYLYDTKYEPDGICKYFYPNGALRIERIFAKGIQHRIREYSEEGELIREIIDYKITYGKREQPDIKKA
jgi:antitoxin component YwqK of YwqJK toxin-antitoxin module